MNSRTIVVGADGSPEAERAVQWAAEQAELEHRDLAVVTAVRPATPAGAGLGAPYSYPLDTILKGGESIAEAAVELARRHRPGITVTGRALVGEPRDVLVDASADAHLLVLGSRGRGPVRSKILGSVGAAVSKTAGCPVVVCRPGTELTVKRGVLVGVDGTAGSMPVLEFAFFQASLRGQPLTIVHCIWDELATVDSPRLVGPDEPGTETARLVLAESVAGYRERYPEVYVTAQVARGQAVDCLSVVADQHDLVVIGRHPVDSFLARLRGSVATEVAERAHTAVAVVPAEWAA